MTTLFFATDIHGSDICWNKFINAGKFYKADVLILGGDMTGKAIVPVVHQGGHAYQVVLLEQEFKLDGDDQLQDMLKRIRSRGYYPYLTNPDEIEELSKTPEKVDQLFLSEVLKVIGQWIEIADKKLDGTGLRVYVCPGNDDTYEVDEIVRTSRHVLLTEGQVLPIDDHHEMISSGWSNPTPWDTYREEGEEQLKVRYEAMTSKLSNPRNAVFNIHVPPYKSNLDEAPELDENLRPKHAGQSLKPVGSSALRKSIEIVQPLLGLHGHIHEGRGASRIGKTLCINPGSMYEQGVLQGALVQFSKKKIENYVLTTG